MKIHPAPQGTGEWLNARLALPTASQFHRIVTPKTLKLSEQRHAYRHQLLAEWLTGEVQDGVVSTFAMERGTEMQPRARAWYELTTGFMVDEVGLCLSDDESLGASPDGILRGLSRGLEIKCPLPTGCVSYLLGDTKAGDEHKMQVQGGMYVCGFDTWDTLVFSDRLSAIPPVLVTVERDKEAQEALAHGLGLFLSELELAKTFLLEKGCVPYLQRQVV